MPANAAIRATVQTMASDADAARLEILLETLEIFAHDLSNPLQSVIVLTELALDDAAPGTEEHLRCRQTLEAAERMRTLVLGLGGLTRGVQGPYSTRSSVERFAAVLSRRWDRHRITLDVELGEVDRAHSPPLLDAALLELGLAAIAAVGERSGAHVLSVRGLAAPAGDADGRCALEVSLVEPRADGTTEAVTLSEPHLVRLDRLLSGPAIRVRCAGTRVSLEFTPQAMP